MDKVVEEDDGRKEMRSKKPLSLASLSATHRRKAEPNPNSISTKKQFRIGQLLDPTHINNTTLFFRPILKETFVIGLSRNTVAMPPKGPLEKFNGIELPAAADMHVHLRDGDMTELVV